MSSNWEIQVRENAAAIQKMLTDAVSLENLPEAISFAGVDWAIIWNTATNRLEKVSITNLLERQGWVWLTSYYAHKGAGNTNKTLLQIGDDVYFKKIGNNGDPITLLGHTYNGGDEDLETSYTQNQNITT